MMNYSLSFILVFSCVLARGDVRNGRHIYRNGIGLDGRQIVAKMAEPSVKIPAKMITCVGCHGTRGEGKVEGGIESPNITWDRLSKPYGNRLKNHRQRTSPYTAELLIRAILEGVDSSGNVLDVAMPRYQLTDLESRDLVTYLEVLSEESDPGIGLEQIHIAVIGADPGDQDEVLNIASEINRVGGIYRRELMLKFKLSSVEPFAIVGGRGDARQIPTIPVTSERTIVDGFKLLVDALRRAGFGVEWSGVI